MTKKTLTRAVVHIGPQKTGTSHLARYLTLASEKLAQQGVLYPSGDLWFDETRRIVKHHQLQSGPFDSNRQLVDTMTKLGEIARAKAAQNSLFVSTTIFVAETSSATLHTPRDLGDFLLQYFDEVLVVFFARRQDKAMASLIAQRIKDFNNPGMSLQYADYVESEKAFLASIDYSALLEKWTFGTQRSRLIVVPYVENERDLMASAVRFLDVLGIEAPPVPSPALRENRFNPTFSEVGLRELAKVKKPAGRFSFASPSAEKRRHIFDEVTKKHHQIAHGTSDPMGDAPFVPWSLSAAEKKQVLGDFAESNRRFLEIVDQGEFTDLWARWLADDQVEEG